MKPRITISVTEGGEFEIYLNETGRDRLVEELQRLDKSWDHFHLAPEGFDMDVDLQSTSYDAKHRVYDWGKVLFRPDEWDAEFYPHVMEPRLTGE